jgi:hypothetical protein
VLALNFQRGCAKITRTLKSQKNTWVFFIVFLAVLNVGLHYFLIPNSIPKQQSRIPYWEQAHLPYWDLLERPNLDWISPDKNPQLQNGKWFENKKAYAQMPISILPNQMYQIKAQVNLMPQGKLKLWFNAQQVNPLQKSQMVQLERLGQKIRVTAWKYNRFGQAQILEVTQVMALAQQVLEVQIATRHFVVRVNQNFLFTAPLSYLGGIPGIGLEQATLEEIYLGANDKPLPALEDVRGLEGTDWQVQSGTWRIKNTFIEQLETQNYDQLLVFQKPFEDLKRIEFEVNGAGAGLVFAMPQADQTAFAHMVRLSEDGKVIFWGQFNQQLKFIGLGNQTITARDKQRFSLEFAAKSYTIFLNGQLIAKNIPMINSKGFLGLTTSLSSAQFLRLQVGNSQLIPLRR